MATLGLGPPYRQEDVKQAYFEKAKKAHPDKGGSVAEFLKLQDAYEKATRYAESREHEIVWAAAQVKSYIRHEQLRQFVWQQGGRVEIRSIDWLRYLFGEDFAHLADRVVGIQLCGPKINDKVIEQLVEQTPKSVWVRWIDLSFSLISDRGLLLLIKALPNLQYLILRGTRITSHSLMPALRLPNLKGINLEDTRVGWWGRLKARLSLKNPFHWLR